MKTTKQKAKTTNRGKHPNSRKNLVPPQKAGEPSRNPNGRPKLTDDEKAFRSINMEFLQQLVREGRYTEYLDSVIKIQVKQGRIDALKFLYESVNGKPPIHIGTTNNQPIEIRFLDA